MIDAMRFSELSLARRLLIVVVTMAVLGVVYWIVAAIVAVTPLWVDVILTVGVVGFVILGIRHDNRIRRRMEAAGQLPLKTRRGR